LPSYVIRRVPPPVCPVCVSRYEHRAAGLAENIVFYTNAATGAATWEDPYEATLAAAAKEAHAANHEGFGFGGGDNGDERPVVLEDQWERLVGAPEAFGDRKVTAAHGDKGSSVYYFEKN